MSRHIAMWSGPRNISTALMRSFGSRSDAFVSDEPLYAAYLQLTGKPHPMAAEIIATHESDWERVIGRLTGPAPKDKTIWYQKHMAHHLLPEISRTWLPQVEHAFLIREPRPMLASLAKKLDTVSLEDTGLPQQVELFQRLREQDEQLPPVIVANDLLADPRGILAALCGRLGVEFDEAMLSWEPGPRDTDGCWGPVWYERTYESTGFSPPRVKEDQLPQFLEPLARDCAELFTELAQHRIKPATSTS